MADWWIGRVTSTSKLNLTGWVVTDVLNSVGSIRTPPPHVRNWVKDCNYDLVCLSFVSCKIQTFSWYSIFDMRANIPHKICQKFYLSFMSIICWLIFYYQHEEAFILLQSDSTNNFNIKQVGQCYRPIIYSSLTTTYYVCSQDLFTTIRNQVSSDKH